MKYLWMLAVLIWLTGCASAPPGPGSELGSDYWSDFQYNPSDGRYYHKTQPDARDMTDFRSAQRD